MNWKVPKCTQLSKKLFRKRCNAEKPAFSFSSRYLTLRVRSKVKKCLLAVGNSRKNCTKHLHRHKFAKEQCRRNYCLKIGGTNAYKRFSKSKEISQLLGHIGSWKGYETREWGSRESNFNFGFLHGITVTLGFFTIVWGVPEKWYANRQ